MTDQATLMPGPELDAMVAEILGWKPERLCYDSPWQPTPCLEGTDCEHDCAHLESGMRSAACRSLLLSPVPRYSVEHTANADVERWLVEHVPTEEDVIARRYLTSWQCVWPFFAVQHTPKGYLEWSAAYGWEDEAGKHNLLCYASATTNETQGDPIAARLLAVCRFAVRVAEEIKKLEVKP
jgi:hypothetical protein